MPKYDAFVSYSHAGEQEIARQLQEGVERFAKPWYRTRSMRLFLDKVGLTASPNLWSAIEEALSDSRWFVLVCSPHAAESPWIEREIRWWLGHRSATTLLMVVADGELRWDSAQGDFDARASTALPKALIGAFEGEPRWVSIPAGTGTVRLFDLELDAEVATFKTPVPISLVKTGIAFSSAGPSLIAASETLSENRGVLVRRNLSDASLVSAACTAAGQELTGAEWRAFVGSSPPGDLDCH